MSASISSERAEPNLTPLLDVVLQLVMFFMLCANFVMEQTNQSIRLPEALSARVLDATTTNYLLLNVDAKGATQISNEVFDAPAKISGYLRNQFELDKSRAKSEDWDAGRGRSVIILRGDKDCTYRQIHDVMLVCRKAGYSDVRLRVLKGLPQ